MGRTLAVATVVTVALVGAGTAARAESPAIDRSTLAWVEIASLTVTEGNDGLTPFTVDVRLHGASKPITVNIIATPGTASASDFVFTPPPVTLPPDGSAVTVGGAIVGDIAPEGDEYFYLTAVVLPDDGGILPAVYSTGGSVLIKDDDQASASRLHVEGATVLEGDGWLGSVEVRVVLEPASASTVTVAYETRDGTATAGTDYVALAGTLTFAPGEVEKTITVNILGDTIVEPDETFTVLLSAPTMALLGTAVATVVLVNDDRLPGAVDAQPPLPAMDAGVDEGGAEAGKADASGVALLPEAGGTADLAPVTVVTPEHRTDAAADTATGAMPRLSSGCGCSIFGAHRSAPGALLVVALILLRRHRRRRPAP